MKAKKLVTAILLAFLAVSVGMLIAKGVGTGSSNVDTSSAPSTVWNVGKQAANNDDKTDESLVSVDLTQTSGPPRQIVAVYFYNNTRCRSCLLIEKWTHEAIKSNFENEIKAQLLSWKTVNTDVPENEHYLKDFDIYTKSVVLVEFQDGKQTRFVNLDKVWDNLQDEAKFKSYVADGVRGFIDDAGDTSDASNSASQDSNAGDPDPTSPTADAEGIEG
jgi:hypothetical protein